MSTVVETQTDQERRSLYIGIGVVFAVIAVVALLMFKAGSTTQAAQDKAAQLTTELQAAGARAPSTDVLVRLFGDDGGAVCADPNAALSKATLLTQLSTGASGPGARPVIAGSRAVQGQLAIMKVYCPDELPDFQKFVDDLKLDNSLGGS
jgi:Tfp pilus assembly protein FimT